MERQFLAASWPDPFLVFFGLPEGASGSTVGTKITVIYGVFAAGSSKAGGKADFFRKNTQKHRKSRRKWEKWLGDQAKRHFFQKSGPKRPKAPRF